MRAGAIKCCQSLLEAADEMDLDADWARSETGRTNVYAFEPATNKGMPPSAAP